MLFLTAVSADSSTLELGLGDICLRLLCAMIVGMVIGTEREYTHRPAGMRTHILVALGACAVMITGQLIFAQYSAYGSTPDPARLGAQVITGVGFLGAGTIIREGANVKGLTTAASLWAVACLGLASGGGYYAVALAGMVFIFITLTIFEVIQNKFVHPHSTVFHYQVETADVTTGLNTINALAQTQRAVIRNMHSKRMDSGSCRIQFEAEFSGTRNKQHQQKFFEVLAADPAISAVYFDADKETAAK